MEGACTSELSNSPKPKRIRTDAGRKTKRSELPSPRDHKQIKTDTGSRKRKAASPTGDKQLPSKKPCCDRAKARISKTVKRTPVKLIRCPTHADNQLKLPDYHRNIDDLYRFNPVSEEWQRRVCQELGLRFVCANACDEGGPNVQLRRTTFRAFSYIITGAEDQHFELRCRIVEHLRSVDYRLIETAITAPTVQEYIANSGVDRQGAWGSVAEMFVLASMVGANVYSLAKLLFRNLHTRSCYLSRQLWSSKHVYRVTTLM